MAEKKKTSLLTWIIAGFLGLGLISYVSGLTKKEQAKINPATYPTSEAQYRDVDHYVGCGSKYSDDKKRDVFNQHFKNHWMTWTGEVVLAEAGEASLNIDGKGTQDLSIDFTDPKAGYDLMKGSKIKVKFLMTRAGGCFLPFSGKYAAIIK